MASMISRYRTRCFSSGRSGNAIDIVLQGALSGMVSTLAKSSLTSLKLSPRLSTTYRKDNQILTDRYRIKTHPRYGQESIQRILPNVLLQDPGSNSPVQLRGERSPFHIGILPCCSAVLSPIHVHLIVVCGILKVGLPLLNDRRLHGYDSTHGQVLFIRSGVVVIVEDGSFPLAFAFRASLLVFAGGEGFALELEDSFVVRGVEL